MSVIRREFRMRRLIQAVIYTHSKHVKSIQHTETGLSSQVYTKPRTYSSIGRYAVQPSHNMTGDVGRFAN
jgi:hypothetical protein